MSTEITTKPIPPTPIGHSPELEYDLTAEDYVACWRFLASESPQHLPRCVVDASEGAVQRFHGTIGFGLLCLFLGAWWFAPSSSHNLKLILIGASSFILLGHFLISKRIYLNDIPGNPWRWAYMRCLRNLARQEAMKGRTSLLDILSHYRFARNPKGFTHTAEYQQKFGDRLVTLWR
jgi:hypothetical protein